MMVADLPMKRSRSLLAKLLLLIVGAAAAWMFLRLVVDPQIREVHTQFLFGQLDQSYRYSLEQGNNPAASRATFLALLPQWGIDWNSCEFRDGTIFDGWGTAVELRVDAAAVYLRSAGRDRGFNTPDDISKTIPNSSGPGPALTSPPSSSPSLSPAAPGPRKEAP